MDTYKKDREFDLPIQSDSPRLKRRRIPVGKRPLKDVAYNENWKEQEPDRYRFIT